MLRTLAASLLLVLISGSALAQEPQHDLRYPASHMLDVRPFSKVVDYPRAKKRAHHSSSVKRSHGKLARPVAEGYEGSPRVALAARPAECPSRAWCGCYLMKYLGLSDRSLWLARNWARIGSPTNGPSAGVVVVWPHHVGLIRRVLGAGRAVVLSGNDGRAVRERERSLRGAIAYRHVGPRYAALLQ